MSEVEVLQTLAVLRAAYPAFYSRTKESDLEATIALWTRMFAEDDARIVGYALDDLIKTHSGYPPDIAALKKRIKEICAAVYDEPTDEDLWNLLVKATSNGYYGAEKEFEKLPKILQRYCGSPNQLREFSMMDSHEFRTVIHGQFLKQIGVIKDREIKARNMPEMVKIAVSESYKPLIDDAKMSDAELNQRRNKAFALLDSVKD